MKNILITPEDLESKCLQCKKDLVLSKEYEVWDGFCEECYWSLEDEIMESEDEYL